MDNKWIKMAAASAVASIAFAGVFAGAPQAKADTAFGSVDLQKIQAGYAKLSDLQTKVSQINDDMTRRLKVQAGYDMLTLDQQQQLEALLAKATRTDVENNTVQQIENSSSHDSQELATLQQKPQADLTDADKARLTTLTAEHQAGQQALQQISDEYQEKFNGEKEKVMNDFSDQVRAAIAAVAKAKGIGVVFDANYAIYTQNDLTDDVIKQLNK